MVRASGVFPLAFLRLSKIDFFSTFITIVISVVSLSGDGMVWQKVAN